MSDNKTQTHRLNSWHNWLLATAGSVVVFFLAAFFSVHFPFYWLLSYIAAFVAVITEVLIVSLFTPKPSRAVVWPLAISVALLALIHYQNRLALLTAMGVTACLLIIGSLLGNAVGFAIKHPGHLLFVALVSGIADTFSVFHPWGPTAAIVQSQQTLSVLALPWPMLGTDQIEPILGLGEVVFSSLYIAATRSHQLSIARTSWALVAGFIATLIIVTVTHLPVPALPFLGFAILCAHRSARTPPTNDRRQGFIALAVILLFVIGLVAYRFTSS